MNLVQPLNRLKYQVISYINNLTLEEKLEGYDNIIERYKKGSRSIFKNWKETQKALTRVPKAKLMLEEIIIPWFKPKCNMEINTSFPYLFELKAIEPALKTEEEMEVHERNANNIQSKLNQIPAHPIKWAESIIQCYANIYMELMGGDEIKGFDFIYNSKEPGAYYVKDKHRITINLYYHKISDILHFGQAILKKRPLENERGATLFLTSIGSSGTLNHELLHAYEKGECSNFHPNGPDLDGNFTTFENRAICIATKVRAEGLFARLREAILKEISFDDLQTILGVAEECEKIDDTIFIRKFLGEK